MTDERRKFLASISKEEHIIRLKIIKLKARMKSEKFWLNHDKCNKEQIRQACWRICCIKTVIKSLKKQLPAPRKRKTFWVGGERGHLLTCPKCENYVKPFSDNYCPTCGQKLR